MDGRRQPRFVGRNVTEPRPCTRALAFGAGQGESDQLANVVFQSGRNTRIVQCVSNRVDGCSCCACWRR
jgi:hypothetical protein